MKGCSLSILKRTFQEFISSSQLFAQPWITPWLWTLLSLCLIMVFFIDKTPSTQEEPSLEQEILLKGPHLGLPKRNLRRLIFFLSIDSLNHGLHSSYALFHFWTMLYDLTLATNLLVPELPDPSHPSLLTYSLTSLAQFFPKKVFIKKFSYYKLLTLLLL